MKEMLQGLHARRSAAQTQIAICALPRVLVNATTACNITTLILGTPAPLVLPPLLAAHSATPATPHSIAAPVPQDSTPIPRPPAPHAQPARQTASTATPEELELSGASTAPAHTSSPTILLEPVRSATWGSPTALSAMKTARNRTISVACTV